MPSRPEGILAVAGEARRVLLFISLSRSLYFACVGLVLLVCVGVLWCGVREKLLV